MTLAISPSVLNMMGVPQDSTLSPLLFAIYFTDLGVRCKFRELAQKAFVYCSSSTPYATKGLEANWKIQCSICHCILCFFVAAFWLGLPRKQIFNLNRPFLVNLGKMERKKERSECLDGCAHCRRSLAARWRGSAPRRLLSEKERVMKSVNQTCRSQV